jgi:nicotinamidase-related amidase
MRADSNAKPQAGIFTMTYMRSPELMQPCDTGLLVIDLQEKLLAVQPERKKIVWNTRRLIDGARILGVAVAATEQYPEKLGATDPVLAERFDRPPATKVTFSSCPCRELLDPWREAGIRRVLACGIETHVCVQQTVLDLLAEGFQVQVAVDAVGSRFTIDYKTALRRMEASGAILTTTETALFEWCAQAGTPEFRQISALAKEVVG